MKNLTLKAMLAAGLCILGSTSAQAATIHPGAYSKIFTEGRRVATMDGADVSGHAARKKNRDVGLFDMGTLQEGDSALMVGRIVNRGEDAFVARDVHGLVNFDVLHYGKSSRKGRAPFKGLFQLVIGGNVVASSILSGGETDVVGTSFSPFVAMGEDVELRAISISGATDFDIAVRITAVPLSESMPMALAGVGALGLLGARRKRKKN